MAAHPVGADQHHRPDAVVRGSARSRLRTPVPRSPPRLRRRRKRAAKVGSRPGLTRPARPRPVAPRPAGPCSRSSLIAKPAFDLSLGSKPSKPPASRAVIWIKAAHSGPWSRTAEAAHHVYASTLLDRLLLVHPAGAGVFGLASRCSLNRSFAGYVPLSGPARLPKIFLASLSSPGAIPSKAPPGSCPAQMGLG